MKRNSDFIRWRVVRHTFERGQSRFPGREESNGFNKTHVDCDWHASWILIFLFLSRLHSADMNSLLKERIRFCITPPSRREKTFNSTSALTSV